MFEHSSLWITPRSPFARRVRLAFLENRMEFEEKVTDVFQPSQELLSVNPLARVPVVKLKSGEVLIDSHLILQRFYEENESPLFPKEVSSRLQTLKWMGIAAGFCDKIVEYYIDTLRPKANRDAELGTELDQITTRILSGLETQLKNSGDWIGKTMTQADLDLGCALGYLNLRYSTEWRHRFAGCAAYQDRLEQRPSLVKTRPPSP